MRILLMCIMMLINLYFFFWLFCTKNHEFQYKLWHDLRILQSSHSHSIWISLFSNACDTWKPSTCHVLCDIVWIHCDETTSDHRHSIWLKCQNRAFLWLNKTVIKISLLTNVNCSSIFKFIMFSDVSVDSLTMSKNFSVMRSLNDSRPGSCYRIEVSFFFSILCFQSVIHIKQSSLKSA